jgi:hypothetical protein
MYRIFGAVALRYCDMPPQAVHRQIEALNRWHSAVEQPIREVPEFLMEVDISVSRNIKKQLYIITH